HFFAKALECLWIAKESSDIDQNIIEKTFDLLAILPEILEIRIQIVDFSEKHPPCDPALDRAGLVVTEIDTAEIPQQPVDLVQSLVLSGSFDGFGRFLGSKDMNVFRNSPEFPSDQFGRKDEVHVTGSSGAPRHGVVFCRFIVLCER